jgi:anti-sigma factor ChrR (cupin superfamily)
VRIDTAQSLWLPGQGNAQIMPLHEFEAEHVALEKWLAGEHFQPHRYFGGEEIFVLSDEFKDEHGNYPSGSRLRSPHMSQCNPYVEVDTVVWLKVRQLPI